MNLLHTDRLTILETAHNRAAPWGACRCVAFVAWVGDEPAPACLAASGLLVDTPAGWVLSHLLVDDEARGLGFGTEIVRFYEDRLGVLGACWASAAGAAFGHRYTQRFGARPHWGFSPAVGFDKAVEDSCRVQLAQRHRRALVDAANAGRVTL